jgi:RIO-like serine/threonine protein kinase
LNGYFETIVKSLSKDDLLILAILQEGNSNLSFKAITRNQLMEQSKLTIFRLKQSVTRLSAQALIKEVFNSRAKSYFLTEFGLAASKYIREKERI